MSSRWDNSTICPIYDDISLQIAGLDPSGEGHTCFVRIVTSSGLHLRVDPEIAAARAPTLRDIVRHVFLALPVDKARVISQATYTQVGTSASDLKGRECNSTAAAEELLKIGAIWIISDAPPAEASCRKTKKSRSRRATTVGATLPFDNWNDVIIRIHYGAIRYLDVYKYDWGKRCVGMSSDDITVTIRGKVMDAPNIGHETSSQRSSKQGLIIHENFEHGYAVIKKPPGIPVHAYVYNSVENVAHMYKEALIERTPTESSYINVSLPHRLDNDTAGILAVAVIATQSSPSFAPYMGKLLEAKTSVHTQDKSKYTAPTCTLSKRYKCLVCVKESINDIDRLLKIADTREIVMHYLSSKRTTPRVYSELPAEDRESESWLECHLRIVRIGLKSAGKPSMPVQGSIGAEDLAKNLWGSSGDSIVALLNCVAVAEVEVELLTGRTHQIRGQMSALGFPLVGDSLYGGGAADNRLALHCCQLSFPEPVLFVDDSDKKGRLQLKSSSELNTFRCDYAWWNECIG